MPEQSPTSISKVILTKSEVSERVNAAEYFYDQMNIAEKRAHQDYNFWACLGALYTSWQYIKKINNGFYKRNKNDPLIFYWITNLKMTAIRGLDAHEYPRRIQKNFRMPKEIPVGAPIEINGRNGMFYFIQLKDSDAEFFVGKDRREIKKELKALIDLFRTAL